MPRYDYRCPACGLQEDRIVPVDERNAQTHLCRDGHRLPLPKTFCPPRARPVIGAKARSKYLKDNDLTELGSESWETVQRESAKNYAHERSRRTTELEKSILEGVSELGDALYTRTPDRPRKLKAPREDAIGSHAA